MAPTYSSLFRTVRRIASAVAIAVLLDAFRKRRPSRAMHLWIALAFLPLVHPVAAQTEPHFAQRVIIVSVDGLRPDVIESFDAALLPSFQRLMTEGAWTLNARSDPQFTITMPNHTSMMTGRWVHDDQSHGWAYNDDIDTDLTIHANKTEYVASIWDIAHDEGGRTALYATKEKFGVYDRSWNGDHGNIDQTSPDYGTDKVTRFVYENMSETLVSTFLADAAADPFDLAFIHLADPDREGHATGWNPAMGSAYTAAIMQADQQIGRLFDFIETDPSWAGRTQLIVTSDHGGTALDHDDPLRYEHYRIPFFVWGSRAEAGADLYAINSGRRTDPGTGHVEQTVSESNRPIHNADVANLALRLMGLPSIPRSPVGREIPLLVRSAQPTDPASLAVAFQDGVAPATDYSGTRDTKLRSDAPDSAFGSEDFLEVDAGPDYTALLKWDLSAVPGNALVTQASIVLHVTNVSTATYFLYALSNSWDESSATWIERRSGESWNQPGSAGSSDRSNTVLADIEGPTLGELRIPLGTEGMDVLQSWINDANANHGFVIQNYDTADDGLDFSSREAAEPSLRPRLEMTYVVPTTVQQPAPPQALFDFQNERGENRGEVTVDAARSHLEGTAVVAWIWDFGDNTAAIGPQAVHSYLNPGTYEVSLTVIDSTGTEDRQSKIVIVDDDDTGEASFQQGVFPLPSYVDAIDTRLMSDAATENFGDEPSLLVDGSPFYATLMQWDLTAIAPGVDVTRAVLTLDITNPTTDTYELYPVLVPWTEEDATWEQAANNSPWISVGAGSETDRLGASLGTLTAGTTGPVEVVFNGEGLEWVSGWINDPATNHGFVIQNYDGAQDGIDFMSSEAVDPQLRPRLDIAYQETHHTTQPEATAFDVWPNPFRSDLNVAILSGLPQAIELEIYDMLGRRVLAQTVDPASFDGLRLDTSFLAGGVYALVLTEHGTRVSSTRLVTRQ